MLFFVSVLNFLDRQVLAIVQEDIKLELGLSDSQLGMLALAFGAVHGLSALPVGTACRSFLAKKGFARLLNRVELHNASHGVCVKFWAIAGDADRRCNG